MGSGVKIFYNNKSVSDGDIDIFYPKISLTSSDDNFTKAQIATNVTDLLKAINNISNAHYAATKIHIVCSSSSSSSSSSTYIVYMDI